MTKRSLSIEEERFREDVQLSGHHQYCHTPLPHPSPAGARRVFIFWVLDNLRPSIATTEDPVIMLNKLK